MSTAEQKLELSTRQAEKTIALRESLNRLRANPDFQRIIEQSYFKDNAVRLVHLLSDPAVYTDAQRTSTIREMDAIGALRSFFEQIERAAGQAEVALENDRRELELVRQEGEEAGNE